MFQGKKSFLNVPSAYSPERYFLPRDNPSIPACRKIRIGPGTYLVPGQKILPERTICVQSGKIFSTPKQPLHPGLLRNYGWSGRLAYPKPKNALWTYYFVQSRGHFFHSEGPIHSSLSRKNFGRSSVLSGVIRLISEPPRTEYSGEPEMS